VDSEFEICTGWKPSGEEEGVGMEEIVDEAVGYLMVREIFVDSKVDLLIIDQDLFIDEVILLVKAIKDRDSS
jgi:hypothetical protein